MTTAPAFRAHDLRRNELSKISPNDLLTPPELHGEFIDRGDRVAEFVQQGDDRIGVAGLNR